MTEHNLDHSMGEESLPATPGGRLRQARERSGLTCAEVAKTLHMTVYYVKSLENDEYDKLPGKTFVKGYMRSYGRLLNLDVEELLESYRKIADDRSDTDGFESRMLRAKTNHDQNLLWLSCAAVLILVVLGAAWWFRGEELGAMLGRPPTTVTVVQAATPVNQTQTPSLSSAGQIGLDSQSPRQAGLGDTNTPAEFELAPPPSTPGFLTEADSSFNSVVSAATEAGQAMSPAMPDQTLNGQEAAGEEVNTEITMSVPTDPVSSMTEPVLDAEPRSGDSPVVTVSQRQDAATGQQGRLIELATAGEDQLRLSFNGASWVEVDNAGSSRIYNDILSGGDELIIRGQAPFRVLLGNARVVREVTINTRPVDISEFIRSDNTARISLEP
jgi:cytoskeleton protein RodZ